MAQKWEGNVRELENVLIQGILFSSGETIRRLDVELATDPISAARLPEETLRLDYKQAKEETLKRFNAAYIGHLLTENDGNVSQAARQCGLERQSLQQIMRRYGIKSEDYRT
mgnify:FL=1